MIVGIIGATGYAGVELLRLLAQHPHVTGIHLASVSFEGEFIEQVYPHFLKKISLLLQKPEAVIADSDLVFASLPAGIAEDYAQACVAHKKPFIDLSADFRFGTDEETYTAWYGKPFRYMELHTESVYGLPELNRELIRNAPIIGNPGCYPTGASLAAFPAIAQGLAGTGTIIVDSASGVTGAGREPGRAYHFPECSDSMSPYKVGCHRHTPEISRNLSAMAGRAVPVIFTPHLVPMNRGILSTVYIPLADPVPVKGLLRPSAPAVTETTDEIRALYTAFYRDEPFVRVLPAPLTAATNRVRASNFCDISVHLDPAGSTLIVISAIDNMVKGAAGQAIENMNIRLGFEETTALDMIPAYF